MFRCPRITQYALEAVLDIAWHGHSGPVQSKEITARQGIPRRYLEQVMQEMVRGGLLVGIRGPRGGYRLARDPAAISIGDVARIIDSIGSTEVERSGPSQSPLGQSIVGPLLEETHRGMLERLRSISIQDLCHRATSAGL